MHLLYCDESNLEHRAGDFLIYAGISIPGNAAGALSQRIDELRLAFGLAPNVRLKFNPRPDGLTHHQFLELKQSIIRTAAEYGCKLFAYAVLHDLAGDPDNARRYGINTVCYHFHCALNRMNEKGIVLIDRFTDANNEIEGHLKEKMAVGVQLHHRNTPTRLSNIVGFHYSAIGQSHFTSLIDIIVSSLRYAINVQTRNEDNRRGALNILEALSPLFFRYNGHVQVPDIGFCFSPMNVRSDRYHGLYIALQGFLREGSIDSGQTITSNG
ncbi:hypothetical protein I5E68_07625 [Novosphingobium sp. YJ-S2-02]|uniref:DUF3800 domain-containing protein n=1 Tax=Novosphingobium aureum TaxID=2792964 RepID=A0A931HBN5_9SPHN|nr:hypothetical protein [Novosphingobium aureum]MBH0112819.1 hypothetical protein [Novosphingobium aureum]